MHSGYIHLTEYQAKQQYNTWLCNTTGSFQETSPDRAFSPKCACKPYSVRVGCVGVSSVGVAQFFITPIPWQFNQSELKLPNSLIIITIALYCLTEFKFF
jgi:hypothetical protein